MASNQRRGVALVMASGLLIAGCTTPTPSTTAASASLPPTTAAPTTAAPAAAGVVTSTTAPLPPQVPQETPALAAGMLFAAWRAGDRVGALKVASAGAVATLFAQAPQPYSNRDCQTGIDGRSYCAFGVGSGLVQLLTVYVDGGWLVQSLVFET